MIFTVALLLFCNFFKSSKQVIIKVKLLLDALKCPIGIATSASFSIYSKYELVKNISGFLRMVQKSKPKKSSTSLGEFYIFYNVSNFSKESLQISLNT